MVAMLAYRKDAEVYRGFETDPKRGDAACLRDALRVAKEWYGSLPAN